MHKQELYVLSILMRYNNIMSNYDNRQLRYSCFLVNLALYRTAIPIVYP